MRPRPCINLDDDPADALHVVPEDDLRKHVISTKCWCKPQLADGVIVHNSMDRREEYEGGRKKS